MKDEKEDNNELDKFSKKTLKKRLLGVALQNAVLHNSLHCALHTKHKPRRSSTVVLSKRLKSETFEEKL